MWDAQYPRVDSKGRVEVRLKAPEATKVRVNFWSGPKVDMVKQADGVWSVITEPLVPGLHYYTLIVDGVEIKGPPVRNTGPQLGRNDPCHCGSGKKFKKCHGAS